MNRRILKLAVSLLLILSVVVLPLTAYAASSDVIQIKKVTADGARLRKGPSSAYDVITSLKDGECVFYLGKTKDSFSYVRTSKGKVGYIYKGFLKSYGAANKSQVYYAKSKNVKVYKKASTNSGKVTKLAKNQHVIVYEVNGNWAYIKTLNGKGGYVKTSSLKKAS